MFRHFVGVLSLILFSFGNAIIVEGIEPQHEYEKPGFNEGHAYDGLIPEESIDLFTGGLILSQRDVPINNITGLDQFNKLITRRYNSKIYRQTLGGGGCVATGQTGPDEFIGQGWTLHFGRLWDYQQFWIAEWSSCFRTSRWKPPYVLL